jgi:hypothetical protein
VALMKRKCQSYELIRPLHVVKRIMKNEDEFREWMGQHCPTYGWQQKQTGKDNGRIWLSSELVAIHFKLRWW